MRFTKHARVRMNQRSIPPLIVEWLMEYGATIHDKHGAELRYFDKLSRRQLRQAVGSRIVEQLGSQLDTYLASNGENVITAAHRTKRIKRH